MKSENLKQTDINSSAKFPDEYSEKKFSDSKEKKTCDERILHVQEQHELQINSLIARNKRILAIIGHDLKSPMSIIIGFLSLLKDRIYTLEKVKINAEVEVALDSARKSFSLLENLLNWAISENRIKPFQQEYSDIAILVQEEIENIKTFAIQKQIRIHAKEIPALDVFMDKDMIKSVFRNLFHNAIKNTLEKGEIIIRIIKQKEYAEVSIKDNGIGIIEEIQKKIFTPKNLDFILSSGKEFRSGFGLILCKDIVDMHGGEIWLVSEPGKGSEFKFTLPLGPL